MTPERIEQAGPGEQRELLLEAWDVIAKSRGLEWARGYAGSFCAKIEVEAYLDAAIMLVPEGRGWLVGWGQILPDEPMGEARITRYAKFRGTDANYDTIADAEASTPALALLAAIIRAGGKE